MAGLAKQTKLHSVAVAALVAASLALVATVAGDAHAQDRNNLPDGQAPMPPRRRKPRRNRRRPPSPRRLPIKPTGRAFCIN